VAAVKATYEHPIFHLKTQKYIEARPFNVDRYGRPSHTITYNLTRKGAELLHELWAARGIEAQSRWNSATRNLVGGAQPEHWMGVKDALIAFESAGKFGALKLLEWYDHEQIRGVLKPELIWKPRIEPDGLIRFEDVLVLIEVDRGTESLTDWTIKTHNYIDLLHASETDPFFANKPEPLVIAFFPGERRLHNVRQTIEQAGGQTNFWLATVDVLADPKRLFDHPFVVATDRQPGTIAFKRSLKD
jgi:hypothetical protein